MTYFIVLGGGVTWFCLHLGQVSQLKRKCLCICTGGAGRDSWPSDPLADGDRDKADFPHCVAQFARLCPDNQTQRPRLASTGGTTHQGLRLHICLFAQCHSSLGWPPTHTRAEVPGILSWCVLFTQQIPTELWHVPGTVLNAGEILVQYWSLCELSLVRETDK